MFTLDFWKATAERAIRAAAASALSALVIGDGALNALEADWATLGGIAAGGAVVSLLVSLAGGTFGRGDGPSFTGTEQI